VTIQLTKTHTRREEHILKVFENRVLRRIFRLKEEGRGRMLENNA
jgi:hypothetical protein